MLLRHTICGGLITSVLLIAVLGGFHPVATTLGQQPGSKAGPELPQNLIVPGKGLEKCSIGMPVQLAIDLFGKPDKEKKGSVHFFQKGVEVHVEDGKIVTLFFHYRSKTELTFDGETDKGIGMWSTIPQVLRRYGKASQICDSIVSEAGPLPGAKDYTIEYSPAGIMFTFYNNELGHITVFAAKR